MINWTLRVAMMHKIDISGFTMSIKNEKIFDVRTLQAFQAAVACGSMTTAAKQLGIGQPAVV